MYTAVVCINIAYSRPINNVTKITVMGAKMMITLPLR